jgi:hypothetical protein
MEKLSKNELKKLVDLVTDDLSSILETESSLAKADPGEETVGEVTPKGGSTDKPEESSSSSEESSSASPKVPPSGNAEEATATPEAPADAAAEAPAEVPADQSEKQSDGQQPDPAADASGSAEALVSEYSKLSPEELKMHFLACKEALMQALGSQEQPDQPAAPAQPAPEAQAESPQVPPGIGKAQLDPGDGNGGEKLATVSKTEMDVAALFAEIETLKKGLKDKDQAIQDMETSFGQAAVGLKKLIERGSVMRKSIASVTFTPKPGSEVASTEKVDVKALTKAEVIEKLNKVATSPALTKSDRDQINSYVFGNCSVEKIEKFLQ